MIRPSWAGLTLGVLLLVGCDEAATDLSCTDVGGGSGVTVRLDAAFVRDKAPARLTVCRGMACESTKLSFSGVDLAAGYTDAGVGLDALPAKPVGLKVRIRDAADVVLVDDGVTVQGEARYPNGKGCDPKVARAALVVGADGSLSPLSADQVP